MKLRSGLLLFFFIPLLSLKAQNYKIIESNSDHIQIEFSFTNVYAPKEINYEGKKFIYIDKNGRSFRKAGEPWLQTENYNIGLPLNKKADIKILNLVQDKLPNISVLAFPDSANQPINKIKFNPQIYNSNKLFPLSPVLINEQYIMRYVQGVSLEVAPFQYNPISRELLINKKIIVQINFVSNNKTGFTINKVNDKFTEEFVESTFINHNDAKDFIGKVQMLMKPKVLLTDTNWYKPTKDYYKIYLKEKGVYKITYDQLIKAGISPDRGIQNGKLELINNGEQIPIDIIDRNDNQLFDHGDYFNFVGIPPKPTTPYTYYNIYNLENVYWFSYQADSVHNYTNIDGYPTNFDYQVISTVTTLHFEKDSLYERLGYAPDDHRDFWLWANAEARGGSEYEIFTDYLTDSIAYFIDRTNLSAALRVNIQGITNPSCQDGHSARIKLNTQIIASQKFNGQNSVTFGSSFNFSPNFQPPGVPLYPDKNKFELSLDGNVCEQFGNDIVRVNWFELDYWRMNRADADKFIFTSPPARLGRTPFYMFNFYSGNLNIYIPSRGQVIKNPKVLHDVDNAVQFSDSVIQEKTEYFCFSDQASLSPDSIVHNQNSDLKNVNQSADYIIITHPNFMSVAQRLAEFRAQHLPGVDNPHIKIVDIRDIYNEFSYGLLDPWALQYFVKYAFENWQSPAPAYITLLGDMSYDYRQIYSGNRPNFIPSIPYQALTFGQAPSDNLIVCIAGNDMIPDLMIGRLSCETVDEGNILIDKIFNYPADNGKNWKQNVLLMSGGIDAADEESFGFNDQSEVLDNTFLKPNGIHASKVYRYPDKPEYLQYQGGELEIRNEFDKGAVFANYYGHGGGGQWDLTFVNDDIYLLNNGGRLPFISSVTCYTAHFDNQDIFGEKFNKVPGKGCVAFFGSSGLTWWQAGTVINNLLFDEIFNHKNYTVGKAILNAKTRSAADGYFESQMALLTLLGDPALELDIPRTADFQLSSSDISVSPSNPVKGNTVSIKAYIHNLGIVFNDSVRISLYQTQIDSSHKIGDVKRGNFGELDSVFFKWIPDKSGLFNLIVEVNSDNHIEEPDHSDNVASTSLAVFDFSEPDIVRPVNGYTTISNTMKFTLVDVGSYVGRLFNYRIEIDTSITLNSSAKIISPILPPVDGIVKWNTNLPVGEYFWRASIFDNVDTNQSKIFTFSINNSSSSGYLIAKKQLNMLDNNNMTYNPVSSAFEINTALLPPKPGNAQFLDSINIVLPSDANGITSFTTDGTYYYFGHLPYYTGNNTPIYRVGTGLTGSVRGKIEAPFPNLLLNLKSTIFYCVDGYLYAALGDAKKILQINKTTGDTLSVVLADSLLPAYDGLLNDGSYYLTSDGNLVYNLSSGYGNYRGKYVLRTFDPLHGWRKVGNDIIFTGSSAPGFSGFFVCDGYLFTYESYESGFMRRFRISDQVFEQEWITFAPFGIYTFCYDWKNNNVLASTFRPTGVAYTPSFYRFTGTYHDSKGNILTQNIGPALKWDSIKYSIDSTGSLGHSSAVLLGLNKGTGVYDTLKTGVPPSLPLSFVDPKIYENLKLGVDFIDTAHGNSAPLKLKSISADFSSLPEISVNKNNFSFIPDTVLQGFNINMELKVFNLGDTEADSITLKYYTNSSDSAFVVNKISIPRDSSIIVNNTIHTQSWAPATLYNTKVISSMPYDQFFNFNDAAEKSFFISRDSVKPSLSVTFDGKDITNGDIVSAKPAIVITVKDNSPLPLDTTMFSLVLDQAKVNYNRPDIKFIYTPYPNSQVTINWSPSLPDGKHTLEIMGEDASGNFIDTIALRYEFNVFNTPDLLNVFNYPNPFKNDTYFTFELHGVIPPEEFKIKVYTVAGRLIKDFLIPTSSLRIGFNKIYWDGRDQDGDEIANGVYFYKIASRNNGIVKTAIEKLAKVK